MSKIKIFALGGLNEIGKNMYVVRVDDDIFVFEAGLKFADDKLLGVDYILPNYDYLIENKEKIKGIFITHGHDEHMGAIADLIKDIPEVKIYGGKFTIEIIKSDLENENANLIPLTAHKKVSFGLCSIFPIKVSHALPDCFLYVLNTPDGAIVFTGNYLFSASMTGPYSMDIGKLAYIGKQGVLCLMNESIYSDKIGFTSPQHQSELIIRETLDNNPGRILFNIFETQLFRIQELFNEISKTNRNVVIMGKNLEEIIIKGIDQGYISFSKDKIKNIHSVNEEGIIVIISNERQKPYSNLKRILRSSDKFITLSEKDTILIASPIYEGIEITSTKIFDKIAKIGAKLVILSKKYLSPHASKEDLMLMTKLINPKYYFPVIGNYKDQVENANLALKLGISEENIILSLNGEVSTFENGILIDGDSKVKVDEVLIDGKTVGDIGDLVIKDREMLSESGIVIVNVNIDKESKKIINRPIISTKGFIYVRDNIDLIKEAEEIANKASLEYIKNNFVDYNKIRNKIREDLGRYFYKETESKPMIIVVIQEL